MLVDSTWYLIHNSARGMLCVGCIESRLGRQLTASDFNDSYLNTSKSFERSARLLDRMRNGETRQSNGGVRKRSTLRVLQSGTALVA